VPLRNFRGEERGGEWRMQSIVSGTMLVLGVSVASIAIATPYRYGAWLDPSATVVVAGFSLNYGTGLLSVLLHFAKVTFVAAIVPAWRRSRMAGALCAVVCLPLIVVSVWNAVALLALQLSERAAEARAAIEKADSRRTELETIGARLALVGWKPLATVEAEIAADRHHWMWDATSGCTAAASGSQRQFCARHVRLEGERATASEAERLRTRETELRRDLALQPVASESRQPHLVLLAAWLSISLDTAEIVHTLLWAAVVEIVEIAAFGFAGFFRSATGAHEKAAEAQHEPPATRDGDKVLPFPREAHEAPKRCRRARKTDRENADPRARQGSRPQPQRRSAPRDDHAQRQAIDMFVATLRRGADLRVGGSALFDAYEQVRERHGWPKIPRNVFGQLLRRAVEDVGGQKVKASRQYYTGVALPLVA
jgi:hypothetical protein